MGAHDHRRMRLMDQFGLGVGDLLIGSFQPEWSAGPDPTSPAVANPLEIVKVEHDPRRGRSLVWGEVPGVPTELVVRCYRMGGPYPDAFLGLVWAVPLGDRWEAGFTSGEAEGRKAASTQAMLEGAAFRVFDPRPLVAALAEDRAEGNREGHAVEALRQALADAGVEVP